MSTYSYVLFFIFQNSKILVISWYLWLISAEL